MPIIKSKKEIIRIQCFKCGFIAHIAETEARKVVEANKGFCMRCGSQINK